MSNIFLCIEETNLFLHCLNGGHYAIYSPGGETPKEEHYPGSWNEQENCVQIWLNSLKRELNSPDKRKLLQEELENHYFFDIPSQDI